MMRAIALRPARGTIAALAVIASTVLLATGCAPADDAATATAAPVDADASVTPQDTGAATPTPRPEASEGAEEPSASAQASAAATPATTPASAGSSASVVTTPPSDGVFDYQLGGAYDPDDEVTIVARDRTEEPAEGVYNICYVNLFQTQPGSDASVEGTTAWWEANHPELLLHDGSGDLVMDDEWDEALFDIRTREHRAELFAIQSAWLDGCASAGFDAVEADNLDQDDRAEGLQTLNDAVQYMRTVIPYAHDLGLAVGQKNTAELGSDGPTLVSADEGFDFAIAEECEVYDECDAYDYGSHVLEIEYTDTPLVTRGEQSQTAFAWACDERSGDHPITLRDRDVVPADSPGYVFEHC